jgi:glycosyltransferase involved in cell wall biosynthesis
MGLVGPSRTSVRTTDFYLADPICDRRHFDRRSPFEKFLISDGRVTSQLTDRRFPMHHQRPLRVLFLVEGFTDIRFVAGLSQISALTMAIPSRTYEASGLKDRILASGVRIAVDTIPGGRLAFQARSLAYLWRRVRDFDVILAQEVLRGALNATVIGCLRGVPVVTYMALPPAQYFRCRRERQQIGWLKWFFGDTLIRAMMTLNGRLASRCLALGPYLRDVATEIGLYYGVDTDYFRPADPLERAALRRKWGLPAEKFVIFFASRMSHEKDPETVLSATHHARQRGLDAVVLNLGGGYKDFLGLARSMSLPEADQWVLGGPAAHPMTELADIFQAVDVVAQASLEEGLGLSPLEGLACGTPVVATAVGGMAAHLGGYARLTPRRDVEAMAKQFLWVAEHTETARAQALIGREYVIKTWNRRLAFAELEQVLQEAVGESRLRSPKVIGAKPATRPFRVADDSCP